LTILLIQMWYWSIQGSRVYNNKLKLTLEQKV